MLDVTSNGDLQATPPVLKDLYAKAFPKITGGVEVFCEILCSEIFRKKNNLKLN